MHEIQFPRNIDNLLASADEHGLMVNAGWCMLIPRASAVEYVKKYDSSLNEGFFQNEGRVILSHGAGKCSGQVISDTSISSFAAIFFS